MSGISKPLVEMPREDGTKDLITSYINNMIDEDDASEITITFRDQFMSHYENTSEIFHLLKRWLRFLPLSYIREILLVPEYGETNRLHFHGIIRAKAKDKSDLLMFLKKRFGRATITSIRNTQKYKEYMLKEDPEEFIHMLY